MVCVRGGIAGGGRGRDLVERFTSGDLQAPNVESVGGDLQAPNAESVGGDVQPPNAESGSVDPSGDTVIFEQATGGTESGVLRDDGGGSRGEATDRATDADVGDAWVGIVSEGSSAQTGTNKDNWGEASMLVYQEMSRDFQTPVTTPPPPPKKQRTRNAKERHILQSARAKAPPYKKRATIRSVADTSVSELQRDDAAHPGADSLTYEDVHPSAPVDTAEGTSGDVDMMFHTDEPLSTDVSPLEAVGPSPTHISTPHIDLDRISSLGPEDPILTSEDLSRDIDMTPTTATTPPLITEPSLGQENIFEYAYVIKKFNCWNVGFYL